MGIDSLQHALVTWEPTPFWVQSVIVPIRSLSAAPSAAAGHWSCSWMRKIRAANIDHRHHLTKDVNFIEVTLSATATTTVGKMTSSTQTMRAVWYTQAREFEVRDVPIPQVEKDEVLLKIKACGICGTDNHIHEGEFIAVFPLIPGHEVVGEIVEIGENVTGFDKGDRCVADPTTVCGSCFYCRRGRSLLCENYIGIGCSAPGGFAEYISLKANKLFKIHNLSDEEATLIEPAACAVHGMDQLKASVGVEALIIGAGPTGLILAQMLKMNGAARVVIAANKGIKVDLAKQLDAGTEYIELDRENPKSQWEQLRKENPYGFDVVVEATGTEQVANDSIDYVRRGGTLMIYGVYSNDALVHWSPFKIFLNEIRIIGSFAQMHCFPRAVAYLDSGRIKVKGMVTDVFSIAEYATALEKLRSRSAVKIAIKP